MYTPRQLSDMHDEQHSKQEPDILSTPEQKNVTLPLKPHFPPLASSLELGMVFSLLCGPTINDDVPSPTTVPDPAPVYDDYFRAPYHL